MILISKYNIEDNKFNLRLNTDEKILHFENIEEVKNHIMRTYDEYEPDIPQSIRNVFCDLIEVKFKKLKIESPQEYDELIEHEIHLSRILNEYVLFHGLN